MGLFLRPSALANGKIKLPDRRKCNPKFGEFRLEMPDFHVPDQAFNAYQSNMGYEYQFGGRDFQYTSSDLLAVPAVRFTNNVKCCTV
jgi:hypothetical protein